MMASSSSDKLVDFGVKVSTKSDRMVWTGGNGAAGRAGALTRTGAPALPRSISHRRCNHDTRAESHSREGRGVGTGQATGQRQPGLQDDGIRSRQLLPVQGAV